MESLANSFSISFELNSSIQPQSTVAASGDRRKALYKVKGSISQDERRRRQLESQKKKRQDHTNLLRNLENEEDESQQMETQTFPPKKKTFQTNRRYSNQLMFSEWFVDIPADLEENWLMVLCPKGRRTLVITNRGNTRAFLKNGYCLRKFSSVLPGGSMHKSQQGENSSVVLDCIFCEQLNTFFILDTMCWQGHPFYNSDTEFRFFWSQSKFSELPEMGLASKYNPYMFKPLTGYSCSRSVMESVIAQPLPFEVPLDGILFYHKHTHYTLGSTPLVGWLKPWMLPEMLGVSVSKEIMDAKPPGEGLRPPEPSEMECANSSGTSEDLIASSISDEKAQEVT